MSGTVSPATSHPRTGPARLAGYLAGCVVFASGATLFIHSELGADPLDVLSVALKQHLSITIGIAQALIALVCIAVWSVWNRRRPVVTPFVTFFLCGSLIDLALLADLSAIAPAPAVAIGLVLCAYGSSLIIMSGIGIRAMDLLVISLVTRWKWPFWVSKMAVEGVLLSIGYVLGGPLGIGTLVFLIFVDGLIQPFMALNRRVLHMTNHGIPTPVPATVAAPAPELTGGAR